MKGSNTLQPEPPKPLQRSSPALEACFRSRSASTSDWKPKDSPFLRELCQVTIVTGSRLGLYFYNTTLSLNTKPHQTLSPIPQPTSFFTYVKRNHLFDSIKPNATRFCCTPFGFRVGQPSKSSIEAETFAEDSLSKALQRSGNVCLLSVSHEGLFEKGR